jgi:hypothetical protein
LRNTKYQIAKGYIIWTARQANSFPAIKMEMLKRKDLIKPILQIIGKTDMKGEVAGKKVHGNILMKTVV